MRILPRLAFQAVDDGDGVGWMATWVVSFWRAHLYRPLNFYISFRIFLLYLSVVITYDRQEKTLFHNLSYPCTITLKKRQVG